MLICVTEHRGVYEPLVDRKVENNSEVIYIPHWASRDVLRAGEEIERLGYSSAGGRLAFVSKRTYCELTEKLNKLLSASSGIRRQMASLNIAESDLLLADGTLGDFMAANADMLQHAGDSWLMPSEANNGECRIISPQEAREFMKLHDAICEDDDEEEEDWDEEDEDDDSESENSGYPDWLTGFDVQDLPDFPY